MSIKEQIHQLVEELPESRLEEARKLLESLADESSVSYADVIDGLLRNMPEDEYLKLPTDLSENLDHYAYGKPKP